MKIDKGKFRDFLECYNNERVRYRSPYVPMWKIAKLLSKKWNTKTQLKENMNYMKNLPFVVGDYQILLSSPGSRKPKTHLIIVDGLPSARYFYYISVWNKKDR